MASDTNNSVTKTNKSAVDWQRFLDINEIGRYADSHYREIQYGIYAVGASGLILLFRSLRLFTKFNSVRKIPDSYIRKQVKLNGFVRSVEGGEKAVINVEHIPVVEFNYHKRIKGLLPVKLGGLGHWFEPEGSKLVADKVLNKRITFQLIEEGPKEDFIVAAVYYTPSWWTLRSRSLNADVVESGMAPFIFEGSPKPINGPDSTEKKLFFQRQPVEHSLAEKLMEAQRIAQKKQLGIWRQVEVVESEGEIKTKLPFSLVPKQVSGVISSVKSASDAVSRGFRYTISAVIYFPAQVKDKILQKRSIS